MKTANAAQPAGNTNDRQARGASHALAGAALLALCVLAALLSAAGPASAQTDRLPVARDDSYAVGEDKTLWVKAPGVLMNDSDPDRDAMIARFVLGAEYGSFKLNTSGAFVYDPRPNFRGVDYAKYRACERAHPARCSRAVLIKITVKSSNDAPAANNDALQATEDTTLNVAAPGILKNDTDPDGQKLSVAGGAALDAPDHGRLDLNADGSLSYRPNPNFRGTDSFTYAATDGAARDTATVTINVAGTSDRPAARADSFIVRKNTLKRVPSPGVLRNDTDADGDRLQVISYTQPARGGVTVYSYGGFVFKPDRNFRGPTSFRYWIGDGTGGRHSALVTMRVR